MTVNFITEEITDSRDIRVIPHNQHFRGHARKPDSRMEAMTGYQIIKVTRPYIISDECHRTGKRKIVKVAHVGDYVVQARFAYTSPLIYSNYRDLQKDFSIPNGQERDCEEDLSYYAEDHEDWVNKQVERWDKEVERSKEPRKRFRTVYMDELPRGLRTH